MPSRRSPSQRRKDSRIDRALATIAPGIHLGRSLALAPMLTPVSTEPVTAAAGGVLGHCEITLGGWPTILTDGENYIPTSLTLTSEGGDHQMTVDNSTSDLSYGVGLYVIRTFIYLTAGTNCVTTDTTGVQYGDWMCSASGSVVAQSSGHGYPITLVSVGINAARQEPPPAYPPSIALSCTGGTNRHYTVTAAGLDITRFAIPT